MRTRIAPGLFVVCLGLLLQGADPGAAQISPGDFVPRPPLHARSREPLRPVPLAWLASASAKAPADLAEAGRVTLHSRESRRGAHSLPNAFTGFQNSRKPTIHTVTIDGTRFSPEALTVSSGDTIVWVNKDLIPHTATSKAGGFDSQIIATGKSWKYVAAKKGRFPYICTFHPTMKGTLRVK